MKKFLKYFLIIILFSLWGIILTNKEQTREAVKTVYQTINPPCSQPLEYSIGQIDPKFGLSKDDLVKLAGSAETVWEAPSGKNLFQYDPKVAFKINLIFDERQEQTLESGKLEENLNNLKLSQEAVEKQYSSLQGQYTQKVSAYEKAVDSYHDRLKRYNTEVDFWNSQGGASPDKYDELQKEKKKLKDLYNSLEKQRVEINNLAGKSNELITKENQIINRYNTDVATYKSKFGDTREFEKGLFNGEGINIYQFQEKSDLELTLAHELGHYLGLAHVENPQSIMYYLIGDQNLDNPAPTEQDLAQLKTVCRLK